MATMKEQQEAKHMDYKVKDRSAKVARRKSRMPVNGGQMKAILVERAAKAQASK